MTFANKQKARLCNFMDVLEWPELKGGFIGERLGFCGLKNNQNSDHLGQPDPHILEMQVV